MRKFIIQKLESHQGSHAVWVDVKDTDETLREGLTSLKNYSNSNPVYLYRLVEALYETRILK